MKSIIAVAILLAVGQWLPTLGSQVFFDYRPQEAYTVGCAGQVLWELEMKNIWGPLGCESLRWMIKVKEHNHKRIPMLQLSWCQRIKRLTACLSGQSLRVDCHYERKTENPVNYEFRLVKDASEGLVVSSNMNVANAGYKNRANVTVDRNLVCLSVHGFTNNDEGFYVCKLKITNDYGMQSRNVSVVKDRLEKCAGISLLIQNTSWLLFLLLSLPLLQAVDFVSL